MSYALFESDIIFYLHREFWPYISVTQPTTMPDSWKRMKKRKWKSEVVSRHPERYNEASRVILESVLESVTLKKD